MKRSPIREEYSNAVHCNEFDGVRKSQEQISIPAKVSISASRVTTNLKFRFWGENKLKTTLELKFQVTSTTGIRDKKFK